MPQVHAVKQGEHVSGIAAVYGFSSYRSIWNHPENENLKKLRKNPNVLYPGDSLYIPDRETREEAKQTEQRHTFKKTAGEVVLRVKVLDLQNRAQSEPGSINSHGVHRDLSDKGDGVLQGEIPANLKSAFLFFPWSGKEKEPSPDLRIPISIGALDPITERSGQRQRLNNLGYFAGFSEKSEAQFIRALQEFQCDHLTDIKKHDPKKEVDGVFDQATRAVLEQKHGV